MADFEKPAIPPYVGLTGVTTEQEAKESLNTASGFSFGPEGSHQLMLGALASPALIDGEPPINTTMPCRHVESLDQAVRILALAEAHTVVGMVHMELGKSYRESADDPKHVVTLLQALHREGVRPAVQLNGLLTPDGIRQIAEETGAPLVLQFRSELSEQGERAVLGYMDEVASHVSLVLMDSSAGTGQSMNPIMAGGWRDVLAERYPDAFVFGFAGGLGGTESTEMSRTAGVVKLLANHTRGLEFALDIETKARVPKVGSIGEDVLNQRAYAAYLQAVERGMEEWRSAQSTAE